MVCTGKETENMFMMPIDTGNKAIKTENFEFNSGITMLADVPGENEEALMYQGRYYRLSHERNVYLPDKTMDDRYYLLTLFAIAKELEEMSHSKSFIPGELISMDLVVGLPPLYYRGQYKKFREYFYRDGKIVHFVYMGKSYRVTFSNVFVHMQTYAAYLYIGGNESMKNYQYLNLEQKMLRIRRKMPTLLKRFYNDEADYDFATLDDIYEAMTPALNKYGVNFDIVREIPTQYDESGHQTYLVLDKDDYWRYEADVELCWTNADRPEEYRHVTIHITGTNEIPDKAHGTALTYGLKYYFRNKFCIRQVGSEQEDPDYAEHDGKQSSNTKNNPTRQVHGKEKAVEKSTKRAEGKQTSSGEGKKSVVSSKKGQKLKPLLGNTPIVKDYEQLELKSDAESCPQEKAEKYSENKPSFDGKDETIKPKMEEKPESEEASSVEKAENTDGFIPVNAEEVPFEEDADFMEELQEELEDDASDSEVEAAKKFVCDFGVFKGKTMEQVLESGVKGTETMKWIVNKYKGPNKELVKAAKTLLDYQSESEELRAA